MGYITEFFGFANPKFYVATLFVECVCLFLLYKLIKAIYSAISFCNIINKIPGPKSYPIIGNIHILAKLKLEDQPRWCCEQSVKYNAGLFRLWLGPEAHVVIVTPNYLERIFSGSVHVNKSPRYVYLEPWLGQGLVTSKGKKWVHDRKLLTPAFHFSVLEQFVPIIQECCEIMLNCIDKELRANPGESIDIFTNILRCALDILCKTSLGIDIGAQERDTEVARAQHRFAELLFYRLVRPWYRSMFIFSLTPSGREHNEMLNIVHDLSRDVIRKKEKNKKKNKDQMYDKTGLQKRKAILDHLMDMRDNGTLPLSNQELQDHVDTFIAAGQDTTATATAWVLFCLGNSPEHQEKVHQELSEVFGDSNDTPTTQNYSELKYLSLVIKETMRLYPPVPLFGRELSAELQLDEYVLPKGTSVIISPYVTHRHPDVWTNPEKFDPERFLPANMENTHPYAYLPFSAGPRNCIGQKLAQLEEKIILVSILRKWRVKSVLKFDEIKYSLPVFLKPLNGVQVYLHPKSK